MYSKWIEIEADVVRENVQAILNRLPEDVALMAVVKNNAYGHGLVETAQLLSEQGVTHWAVTWLEEAIALRSAGIQGEILLLAPTADERETQEAIAHRITLCVASNQDVHQLCQTVQAVQTPVQIHFKIETGLSRFGFMQPVELQAAAAQILRHPEIEVTGAFTHMADAGNAAFTQKQFERFMKAVAVLKQAGITPPCLHCANSGVFLRYPHMYLNMVRLGTLLCGQYPDGKYVSDLPLKDPFHYKTRIRSIKKLPAGSFLGYKRTWRLRKPAQVAVLPVGYSDGLGLTVNNRAEGWWDLSKKLLKLLLHHWGISRFQLKVKIRGEWYPVRGKIFMQMALVELPNTLTISPNTEVEVFISKTLAAKDVPRVFVQGDSTELANVHTAEELDVLPTISSERAE